MRTGYAMLRALLAAFSLCVAAIIPACAQEMTFAFQPPEKGISFVQTERMTETDTMTHDGDTEKRVVVTVQKTKIDIAKTANGYTLTEVCTSYSYKVDGEDDDPDIFNRVACNVPIVYVLVTKGQLTDIKGLDAAIQQIRKGLDEEEIELYDANVTAEKMEKRLKDNWIAEKKPLLGFSKKLGDTWRTTTKELIFSQEALPITNKTALQKTATIADRPCAVLKTVRSVDLKAAAKDFHDYIHLPQDIKCTINSYSDESTEYVDPTLLYSLKNSRVESFKGTFSGQGETMTIAGKRETSMTTEFDKK